MRTLRPFGRNNASNILVRLPGASSLQRTAIITLAWLMKDVDSQTPDSLNLKAFTENPLLLAAFENTIKEHWDSVGIAHRKYSKEELLNDILFDNKRNENFLSIKKLMIQLLDIHSNDKILVLDGGQGDELIEINANHPDCQVSIVDTQDELLITELKANIIGANPLLYQSKDLNPDNMKANKVLAFETDLNDILIESAISSLSQDKDSKVIIFTNERMMHADISQLIKNKQLEAVISINQAVYSGEVYILSHDNDHVCMVDASKHYTENARGRGILSAKDIDSIIHLYQQQDDIHSRLVPTHEIAWNSYQVRPLTYLSAEIEIPNAINLGDVCTINRGTMLSSKELNDISSEEETDYRYLSLKHLLESGIDLDLPYLKKIDSKQHKYCLTQGQVIVSKMSPFRVCMAILPEGQTVLVSGNLYFLDVDTDKVSPIYLKMFLESELGISQLDRFSKGRKVKTISIADLKQVQIPILSLSEQHKVAEAYQKIEDEAHTVKAQLESLINKKRSVITDKLDSLTQPPPWQD